MAQENLEGNRLGMVLAGKYRLVRLIGTGGVGEVYQAENTWTGGRVAVKVLRSGLDSDPEIWQRFMREARAAAQIVHPNVVMVLDLGHDPAASCIFMVQELLQGQTLRDRLTLKGRLPLLEALDVVIPIMGAVATAHDHGVLHRDIKPENIFLSQRISAAVEPKLIDFGVSKMALASAAGDLAALGAVTGRMRQQATLTGVTMGTPHYMAPEQLRADRDLDGRMDVWAMGVVLYEILCGQLPFRAANLLALGDLIINGTATPLSKVAPEVPEGVSAIVLRALRPEREERFGDMRKFVDALLDCPDVLAVRTAAAPVKRYGSAVVWRGDEAAAGWESTATALDLEPVPPEVVAPAAPVPPLALQAPAAPAETTGPTLRPEGLQTRSLGPLTPLPLSGEHRTSTAWPAPMQVTPSPRMAGVDPGGPEDADLTQRPTGSVSGVGSRHDPDNEATSLDPHHQVPALQGESQRLSNLLVEARLAPARPTTGVSHPAPRPLELMNPPASPEGPSREPPAAPAPAPASASTTAERAAPARSRFLLVAALLLVLIGGTALLVALL